MENNWKMLDLNKLDVHSEAFGMLMLNVLTKFVNENDDMAIMDIRAKANALLDAINDL